MRPIYERMTMPDKKRIKLFVTVDLDPMPGAFHDKEDAAAQIQAILDRAIPHYKPGVLVWTE